METEGSPSFGVESVFSESDSVVLPSIRHGALDNIPGFPAASPHL